MWGRQAFMAHQEAHTVESSVRASISSVLSSSSTLGLGTKALLTRMSSPPKTSTAVAIAASRLALRVTSVWTNNARAPRASHSAATAGPVAVSISAITTIAPSRAKRRATPRPMPVPAPVMKAILSLSRPMSSPAI